MKLLEKLVELSVPSLEELKKWYPGKTGMYHYEEQCKIRSDEMVRLKNGCRRGDPAYPIRYSLPAQYAHDINKSKEGQYILKPSMHKLTLNLCFKELFPPVSEGIYEITETLNEISADNAAKLIEDLVVKAREARKNED